MVIELDIKKLGDSVPIMDILQELKGELQNRYRNQLKSVILFGSCARGEKKICRWDVEILSKRQAKMLDRIILY
ncbi:MAG: hypothetical protein JXA38_06935 [Methanosarcinaceae archaeon]|nr:hypothetical protein [Methanosarcinaceae archaeon]